MTTIKVDTAQSLYDYSVDCYNKIRVNNKTGTELVYVNSICKFIEVVQDELKMIKSLNSILPEDVTKLEITINRHLVIGLWKALIYFELVNGGQNENNIPNN